MVDIISAALTHCRIPSTDPVKWKGFEVLRTNKTGEGEVAEGWLGEIEERERGQVHLLECEYDEGGNFPRKIPAALNKIVVL